MHNVEVLESKQSNLATRVPVEIVLAEDASPPITLKAPSINELLESNIEVRALSSARQQTAEAGALQREQANQELTRLKRKFARFSDNPVFLNRLAGLAQLAGDPAQALELTTAAAAKSSDAYFQHRMADVLIQLDDRKKAVSLLERLEKLNDVHATLRLVALRLADMDFGTGQYSQTVAIQRLLEQASRAVELDPLDYSARMLAGGLNLVLGDFQQAIHHYRAAQTVRPESSPLHTNLGIAYLLARNRKKAMAAFARAATLDPLNRNAVTLFADLADREGKSETAVPKLKRYIRHEQREGSMWERLAIAQMKTNDLPGAWQALALQKKLLESEKRSTAPVFINMGCWLYHKKRNEEAVDSFKHAMGLWDEDHHHGYGFFLATMNAVNVLSRLGKSKELIALADYALRKDTNAYALRDERFSDVYRQYIWALSDSGEPAAAVSLAEAVLTRKEASLGARAAALVLWAACNSTLGESARSARLFLDDPTLMGILDRVDAQQRSALLNNFIYALLDSGMVSESHRFIGQLAPFAHREPYPTATLGLYRILTGKVDEGRLLYRKAATLAGNIEEKRRIRRKMNLELGRNQIRLGRPDKARYYLTKASIARKDDEIAPLAKRALLSLPKPD